MLERFFSKFRQDGTEPDSRNHLVVRTAEDIVPALGGRSFNGGLYRLHATEQIAKWNAIVAELFGQYAGRIECFGYDWLGRQFALDAARVEGGRRQVLMLQLSPDRAYEIPSDIVRFHEHDLVDLAEPALEVGMYEAWRALGNLAPGLSECAGYKRPLLMGGRDEVENLAVTDMEVEWEIVTQMTRVKRTLPEGARIDRAEIG